MKRVKIEDGSTWPDPRQAGTLERTLRYGEPTRSDCLAAAAIIDAYIGLVTLPEFRRKPVMIRRALKKELS